MTILGVTLPQWVFDWSGSLLVAASLVYLVRKNLWYWHYSNASLLPYFEVISKGVDDMSGQAACPFLR